ATTGLFPLSRDRVLRRTPKSPAQLIAPALGELRRDFDLPDHVPQTPTTLVSAEGFILSHNLIKRDTSTLDETSTLRKLANAGQKAIAYCALLQHKKQLLKKINSEAKVRRSTKSIVLSKGQGKVMSFKDIVVARAERAAKDVKGKGRRDRKRKSVLLDEGKPESDLEPNPSTGKRARKRTSIANAHQLEPTPEPEPVSQLEQIIVSPETWSAPVAQMY
ncbi:hypothetical protein BJ875DRAFT_389824, partial [Amylocarpus encephaloides]